MSEAYELSTSEEEHAPNKDRTYRQWCKDEVLGQDLRLALCAVLVIAIGIGVLMYFQGWAFVTAVYVIVQIITTIGYGDCTVQGRWTKVWMAFYILLCLVIVTNFANRIINALIEREKSHILERLKRYENPEVDSKSYARKKKRVAKQRLVASIIIFAIPIAFGTLFYGYFESCSCSYGRTREASYADCTEYVEVDGEKVWSYDECMKTGGQRTNYFDAFYMSVVTATTIGYGDKSPISYWGRVVAIPWMLLSVASAAVLITQLTGFLNEDDEQKIQDLSANDITDDVFKTIDVNQDGVLSKSEYRCYVLMKYGIVTEDIMKEIDSVFDRMDLHKSGRISREVVEAVREFEMSTSESDA